MLMSSKEYLNYGRSRARVRLERESKRFPTHGLFEASARFLGDFPDCEPGDQFIQVIQRSTPYFGEGHSWAFFDEVGERYYQTNKDTDGFETHCYSVDKDGAIDSIRFNRFSTSGLFYHLRTLADDDERHGTENRKPYSGIDIDLPVIDALASSAIAIRYGRFLNLSNETGKVALSFRWSGLKGRIANAWIRYSDRWPFESSKRIEVDYFEMSTVLPSNTTEEDLLSEVFPKLKPFYKLMLRSEVQMSSFTKTAEKLFNR